MQTSIRSHCFRRPLLLSGLALSLSSFGWVHGEATAPSAIDQRVEAAFAESSDYRRTALLNALALELTAATAREAADAVQASSDEMLRSTYLGTILSFWGELDPKAAMEYALAVPVSFEQTGAVAAVLSGWAASDVDAALAWADEQTNRQLRDTARQTVIIALAAQDSPRALAYLLAQSPVDQQMLVYPVFDGFAAQDPEVIAKETADLPTGQLRETAIDAIAARWGSADPVAAVAWASKLDDSSARQRALRSVLSAWSVKDFAAASVWIEEHAESDRRDELNRDIVDSISYLDPENAVVAAQRIDDETLRAYALQGAGSGWGASDPAAAEAWVKSLEAPADLNAAWAGVVLGIAQVDAEAASELLDKVKTEENRSQAIASISYSWATSDPAAAARWAGQLKDDVERGTALGNVMSTWVTFDASGALEFFGSVPKDATRDSVLQSFLLTLGQSEPALGLELAQEIGDPDLRTEQVTYIASDWLQRDRAAATDWIEKSKLDPELRKQLLAPPDDGSEG